MRMYEGTPEEIAALHGLQNAEWQAQIDTSLNTLHTKVDDMATSQSQAAADLRTVKTQLDKISTESGSLLQKISDLEAAAAAAGNVTPELQAAINALKTQAQVLDDLVPDTGQNPPATNPGTANPA